MTETQYALEPFTKTKKLHETVMNEANTKWPKTKM